MPDPSPSVVAGWLESEKGDATFKPLVTAIADTLSGKLRDYSPERVAELSEALTVQVLRELERRAADYQADGVLARFEISGDDTSAYLRYRTSNDLDYLAALTGLSSSEFESFCANILKYLGAEDAFAEGGSDDGGVDFVGFGLSYGKDAHSPLRSRGFVIGQAKKYTNNNITLNDLRKFVGSGLLQAWEKRRDQSDRLGMFTPCILAYWTTSDFHWMARDFAKSMGIWHLNGISLAQLGIRLGIPKPESGSS